MISMATRRLRLAWQFVRTLAGDDAYDRYQEHQHRYHADRPAMDRKAFYLHSQQQKWSGVNRCC